MRITHVGLTPVKGLGHTPVECVAVQRDGLARDRLLALADAGSGEVLRTVRHPRLTRVRARWDGDVLLLLLLPDGDGVRQTLDERSSAGRREVHYWHHRIPADLHDGPVAQALSEVEGRRLLLAHTRGRRFRWAEPVSVVFRSEVAQLAARTGHPELLEQPTRWRGSAVVDDRGDPVDPRALSGRRMRLGTVEVCVTAEIDRCAVIDTHPLSGARDVEVLAALAAYRRSPHGIHLGVRAEVIRPGWMGVGDPVTLGADAAGGFA